MARVLSACAPTLVAPGAGAVPRARMGVPDRNAGELRERFDAMDPAPVRERNLGPNAEEYVGDREREARGEFRTGARSAKVVP